MDNIIDVSVIIPSKDALRWLPGAIASIGEFPNAEILVVDDGSSDGTADFLVGRMASDSRVRALKGKCNGPSAARNLAIRESRGSFVAFLDADDRWALGKLHIQLAAHKADPSIGMSFTDYDHVTEDGRRLGTSLNYWPEFRMRHRKKQGAFNLGEDAFAQLYAENVVGTSTVMVRRDLLVKLGGFDESLNQAEDWDLWLKLAAEAPVCCIKTCLADYLMHRPGNLSHHVTRRANALQLVAERHRDYAATQDIQAVRTCEARLLAARAEAAQIEGRLWSALWLYFDAFKIRPNKRTAKEVIAAALRHLKSLRLQLA